MNKVVLPVARYLKVMASRSSGGIGGLTETSSTFDEQIQEKLT
jgi:hypothetical protein